jgi:hypothetical protein
MADIVGAILKMTDVEIASDAPITEALMTKMGANINALIDLNGNLNVFTAGGAFVVPKNVTRIYCLGIGGGGGGGGGGRAGSSTGAGGGGGGTMPVFGMMQVTPLETLTVTVGSGGAGGALSGSFGAGGGGGGVSGLYRGSERLLYALGGDGGLGSQATGTGAGSTYWTPTGVKLAGGGGGANYAPGNNITIGGAGADSSFGLGGPGGLYLVVSGIDGGGGGGGTSSSGMGGANGAAGRPGIILIAW